MFKNIGNKIKILATVMCILGMAASVALSVYMFVEADDWAKHSFYDYEYDYSYYGYSRRVWRETVDETKARNIRISAGVILVVGPLISWLSQFLLYGFGELVDRTSRIDDKMMYLVQGQQNHRMGYGGPNPGNSPHRPTGHMNGRGPAAYRPAGNAPMQQEKEGPSPVVMDSDEEPGEIKISLEK